MHFVAWIALAGLDSNQPVSIESGLGWILVFLPSNFLTMNFLVHCPIGRAAIVPDCRIVCCFAHGMYTPWGCGTCRCKNLEDKKG